MGKISKEIETATNGEVKSFPVYLKVGFHAEDTRTGMGYKHIMRRHLSQIKQRGFDTPIDYIKHILQNFDKIFKNPPKRIILFCSDDSKGFMPLQLVEEDNYYSITTAYPNENRTKNGELVFDRSTTLPVATTNDNTETIDNKSINQTDNNGGVNLSGANVLTNSPNENISQTGGDSNTKYSKNSNVQIKSSVVVTGKEFGEY